MLRQAWASDPSPTKKLRVCRLGTDLHCVVRQTGLLKGARRHRRRWYRSTVVQVASSRRCSLRNSARMSVADHHFRLKIRDHEIGRARWGEGEEEEGGIPLRPDQRRAFLCRKPATERRRGEERKTSFSFLPDPLLEEVLFLSRGRRPHTIRYEKTRPRDHTHTHSAAERDEITHSLKIREKKGSREENKPLETLRELLGLEVLDVRDLQRQERGT